MNTTRVGSERVLRTRPVSDASQSPLETLCVLGQLAGYLKSDASQLIPPVLSGGAPSVADSRLSNLTWPRIRNVTRGDLRPMRQGHDFVDRVVSP